MCAHEAWGPGNAVVVRMFTFSRFGCAEQAAGEAPPDHNMGESSAPGSRRQGRGLPSLAGTFLQTKGNLLSVENLLLPSPKMSSVFGFTSSVGQPGRSHFLPRGTP